MIKTQTLEGNLINENFSTAFILSQGDKGVPFKVNLLENGTPYSLKSDDVITIEWLKPNNKPFLQEGSIKYGSNYIEFTTPESIAQQYGSGYFNVIISNGTTRKGTIRREYRVVQTSMSPGSVSEDVITDAITELRELSVEIADTVQNNQNLINNNQAATKQDIANVNSSLEEKANSKYVDNEIIKINSDLEGKINKDGIVTMANMGQDVKEAMTGGSVAVIGENTVLSNNIVRSSINVEHVSFLKSSRNLFNYNSLKDGYKLKENYGTLEEDSTMVTHEMYIPVFQNTTYCMTKINKNIVIHFYDYSKQYLSQTNIDTTTTQTFTTPSDCYYIRLFTFLEVKDLLKDFQIEMGTALSEYNIYQQYIIPIKNIEDSENLEEILTVLTVGKNMLNSDLFIDNKALETANGKISDNTSLMATVEYIPAKENTDYAITSVQGAMIFCFYDENKTFISSVNIDTSNTITTTSPTGTRYIRLCTFKNKRSYFPLQLEEGTVNTSYEAYGKYINKKYLNISTDSRFEGLIWNSLGDSITKMNDYIEGYQTKVANRLGIGTIRNYGIGGTLLCLKDNDSNSDTAMCNRYVNMNDTADIITVMGGANDWSASRKLDSETNKYDKHTIGGAMRTIIEGLMTKYPTKHIIWLTCPPRMCTAFASQLNDKGEQVDNNGNTIEDIANKQIEVCNEYNLPYIDIHHKCGFNRHNIDLFTASNDHGDDGTPDDVHMNNLGHERLASPIITGFEEFIY